MATVISILIAALTLCFAVFSALTGVLMRIVVRYTRTESKLDAVAESLREMAELTDRRLRYLEEWHMRQKA